MTQQFSCNIVADNNTDFIIADNIANGKIPVLLQGSQGSFVSNYNFDIDTLCQQDYSFKVGLRQLIKNISANNKTGKPLNESLALLQNFMEQKLPLCPKEKTDLRNACIFDADPFSYLVANKMAMCSERAALSQYVLQNCGIKSYYVNSMAQIQNVTTRPGQHSYLIINNNNKMLVYDPANPRRNNQPRILNSEMDSVIFADFIAAINYNTESNNNLSKKRVGFLCVDEHSGKNFLYHSLCGKKGENITPSKLKAARITKTNNCCYEE